MEAGKCWRAHFGISVLVSLPPPGYLMSTQTVLTGDQTIFHVLCIFFFNATKCGLSIPCLKCLGLEVL